MVSSSGGVAAVDARSAATVVAHRKPVKNGKGSPMTYTVGGTQYVAMRTPPISSHLPSRGIRRAFRMRKYPILLAFAGMASAAPLATRPRKSAPLATRESPRLRTDRNGAIFPDRPKGNVLPEFDAAGSIMSVPRALRHRRSDGAYLVRRYQNGAVASQSTASNNVSIT